MFTFPASSNGGIILVARPSASSGTITNPTLAYDQPSGKPDDYPYATSADRATVSGSAVAGTADNDIVEFNTFPSRSKSNFSTCNLLVAYSSAITGTVSALASGLITFVTPGLSLEYSIDGTTWLKLSTEVFSYLGNNYKAFSEVSGPDTEPTSRTLGDAIVVNTTKRSVVSSIQSSLFPSNLNTLKVRMVASTLTSTVSSAYKSSVSYNIWDIRANIY